MLGNISTVFIAKQEKKEGIENTAEMAILYAGILSLSSH